MYNLKLAGVNKMYNCSQKGMGIKYVSDVSGEDYNSCYFQSEEIKGEMRKTRNQQK